MRAAIFVALLSVAVTACERNAGHNAPVLLARDSEQGVSRVVLDDETRLALTPNLLSRLTFDVHVPSRAVLRFAIATRPLSEAKHWPPIEFRILVNGETAPLFAESLNRDQAGRWLDREVDLSSWAGRRLQLVLETDVPGPRRRLRRAARRATPLWGNPSLSSSGYRADRPNILLVSIDCLRADHVGAYGYPRPTTTNIDALAKDSSVFEAATSVSSWTLPTHLSMLTGLMPSEHGVRAHQKLGRDVLFLPELLSRAGYRVDGVASWYFLSQVFGFDRGFHSYKLLVARDAEEVIDTAIELVRRGDGGSQFLFVHLIDPHSPYEPPKEWIQRFGRPRDISDVLDRISLREPPSDPLEVEEAMNLYDGEIAHVDDQLGRLIGELKARALYDDTLIVVTADHGEAFYEHGHWEHTVSLYDEVTHVPLIVKWPRGSQMERVTTPVSQVDIFPTILEAAGVDPPETGASSLRGPGERSVVSELTSADGVPSGCDQPPFSGRDCVKLAVRAESMKYIAKLAEEDGALRIVEQELYDLARDPLERHDLSEEETARVEDLSASIQAFLKMARARTSSVENVTFDEETTEKLKSLGYVQ